MKLPQRPESHQREELSERYFCSCLPRNWTAEKLKHDYGIDLRVNVNAGPIVTGREFIVQLKASAEPSGKLTEQVQLELKTYNLLMNSLPLAMLVKYIEAEDEAYWVWLRDVEPPKQENDTFTVHIPRDNRLSTVSWDKISERVQTITELKLAAMNTNQVANGFVQVRYESTGYDPPPST